MRTPAGFECRFFYGDYYRGRKHEECRLIGKTKSPRHWTTNLCKNCPVPRILQANACANMVLSATVTGLPFGLARRVVIKAHCTLTQTNVTQPEIGCGQCHPLPDIFTPNSQC